MWRIELETIILNLHWSFVANEVLNMNYYVNNDSIKEYGKDSPSCQAYGYPLGRYTMADGPGHRLRWPLAFRVLRYLTRKSKATSVPTAYLSLRPRMLSLRHFCCNDRSPTRRNRYGNCGHRTWGNYRWNRCWMNPWEILQWLFWFSRYRCCVCSLIFLCFIGWHLGADSFVVTINIMRISIEMIYENFGVRKRRSKEEKFGFCIYYSSVFINIFYIFLKQFLVNLW